MPLQINHDVYNQLCDIFRSRSFRAIFSRTSFGQEYVFVFSAGNQWGLNPSMQCLSLNDFCNQFPLYEKAARQVEYSYSEVKVAA